MIVGSPVRPGWRLSLLAGAAALGGCASRAPMLPVETPQAPAIVSEAQAATPQVRSTIVPGTTAPPPSADVAQRPPRAGNIALNLPNADVRAAAHAVEEVTGRPIAVEAAAQGQVSLVTPGPVARSAVIGLFEAALRSANLALVPAGSGFIVRPVSAAQSPASAGTIGFGSEVVTLRFINAEELRKVLDGALPGVVSAVEPASNTITIAGTTGQRASARDLIAQFDVDWLRNMSFALFVPERTDARLIAPELNKLINAADSPTRGMVRLIAMERLNGILAVTAQRQYLDDVRRWIDILDREGQSAEPRVFVYRVQNGRARDLARTLNRAFGGGGGGDDAGNADPFASDAPTPTSNTYNRQGSGGATPVANGGGAASGSTPAPPGATPVRGGAAAPAADTGSAAQGSTARVTADEVNNAIVVYGTPRDYAVVEDALRKLDVPPYQVMIEAAITEVTLTDDLRYGVQWNFLTGQSNFVLSQGTSAAIAPILPGFSYFLSGNDISATLNALEQRTNIKVISAPKLLVLNNQTAALQVGDQVPVAAGNAVSVENPNAPIVNSIEYRDTGVILKVTPRVNTGGLVLLDVSQEVSDVSASGSTSVTSSQSTPTISTRRVSTSVAVQDGQVIALGGLFRNAQTFGKNGIPILSRIPVLGALFGNQRVQQNRTELIVLLKPHVVRTLDDGRAVTEELRAKLRTLEPFRTQGRIP